MITIFYVEDNIHKKESFNVPDDEYLSVIKVLKDRGYKWYTVDKGLSYYDPNQLTLDFGEMQ